MQNKILSSLFPAFTACFLFLTSCTSNTPSTPSNLSHRSLYLDYATVDTPSFVMEGLKPKCESKTYNYSLEVSLQITNKEQKAAEYLFKDPTLQDETQGGKYKVTTKNEKETVDPGMTVYVLFSSTIPLSITEHKYKLSFDMNGYRIDYGLYDTPDELRTDWTLKYYASGKLVNTVKVRDGRGASRYIYESSDRLEYCENWYTDEAKTKYFGEPWTVNSDMNVYGDALPCFDWDTSSNPDYSIMKKCNHAPTDRKIKIPRYYDNKEIYIGRNAIRFSSGVDVIYIPITVRGIDDGNVTGLSFTAIYYEGSEEEWNAMYKGKPPVNLFFMNHDGFPY